MPKHGRYPVGVARQCSGALGKQANCQVAVTMSLINEVLSIPCAYKLYLPEEWTRDPQRRAAAEVPRGVKFHVKFQKQWEIALAMIDQLRSEGLVPAPVVADSRYAVATHCREALTKRGLVYAVGVTEETTVWPPGKSRCPRSPARTGEVGRRACTARPSTIRSRSGSWPPRSRRARRDRALARGHAG
jgi:SRSO17 transposase